MAQTNGFYGKEWNLALIRRKLIQQLTGPTTETIGLRIEHGERTEIAPAMKHLSQEFTWDFQM